MSWRGSILPSVVLVACNAADPQPVGPDPTHARFAPAPAPETKSEDEFVGVVITRNSEVIPVPYTARVTALAVWPGMKIKAGDPIATLDDVDLKNQIRAAISGEKSSRSTGAASATRAAQARADANTEEKLIAFGAGTRTTQRKAESDARSHAETGTAAVHQGEQQRFQRKLLERQLEDSRLVAKKDGVVMEVKVKEGEKAQEGAVLARILDDSNLMIKFAVSSEQRHRVRQNASVEVRVEGVSRPLYATIVSISVERAPINLTVVVADLDDRKLAPDEVAVASIAKVRLVEPRKEKRT